MKQEILKLREQGKTYKEIVQELGCSKALVSYYCNPHQKNIYTSRRRINRKKSKTELKKAHGGKCSICGYDKCLGALHFHHSGDKSGSVSDILKDKGNKAAVEEAKKCILVCANCHAELHYDGV